MNALIRTTILAAVTVLSACSTLADQPGRLVGDATLSRPDGEPVGTAHFVQVGDVTTLSISLTGLPPGAHGFHLHTVGACVAPDFASAGGHLNPLGRHHGSLAPGGMHEGDLPNITIAPGGSGTLSVDLAGTPHDVRAWLFDTDGTAIVVHADPDDYTTDPSGNSGKRIACGVITPAA